MFCDQCGKGTEADATFCAMCGARLVAVPHPTRDGEETADALAFNDYASERETTFRAILEDIGEGHLAAKENLSLTGVNRLRHTLALRVIDIKQDYTVSYSGRDLQALQEISEGQLQTVLRGWQFTHPSSGITALHIVVWAVFGLAAWHLLTDHVQVRSFTGDLLANVPTWALYGVGAFTGLMVAVFSSVVWSYLTAHESWQGYRDGYTQGLREGINRALCISPEQEQRMDEEWHEAELAGEADGQRVGIEERAGGDDPGRAHVLLEWMTRSLSWKPGHSAQVGIGASAHVTNVLLSTHWEE